MSELGQLQSSLAQIFREAIHASTSLGSPQAIKALQKINQELNGVSPAPTSASIAQVVEAYRHSQRVAGPRELKYVCYGAAMQMQDGWSVLGNEKLRDELLADVARLDKYSQRLKCFEALLMSYFSFPRYEEKTSKAAHAGWKILRDWLAQKRAEFQRDGANKKIRLPGWFAVLTQHENLLTNKPCDRYGEDILRGDNSSIEEARQGLGISSDSWVMQEAILSQVRAAVALGEEPFKVRLDPLLRLAQGQTEVKVSDLLKRRAIALLISRYARCVSKPEQPVLRDAAVSIIGNPWLKRTAWDAWVKKPDGQPDEEARQMINGWITRRLIRDFFELLSADGKALQRRIDYWLKYESQIEDLWFVLGPNAWGRDAYDPRYKAVRDRSDASQWLEMSNVTNKDNNAFVMRIGDKLVIEFWLTGHACFFYSAEPMPFVLGETISERRLKIHNQSGIGKKLSHHGSWWEDSFDSMMASDSIKWIKQSHQRIGVDVLHSASNKANAMMSQSDNAQNIEKFAADWKLKVEDNRTVGGALWVCTDDSSVAISYALKNWGFRYKYGKGWWKE